MLFMFALVSVAARTALGIPKGFSMNTLTITKQGASPPMDIRWLDSHRALVLFRNGVVKIMQPYSKGNPTEVYMQLENCYTDYETGALSIALDPDWGKGQRYVYVYWGKTETCHGEGKWAHCDGGAMRISRFQHYENRGGVSSRSNFGTEKKLWEDSDGWGGKPQWHYGGSLQFGPEQHLYLTLGAYAHVWFLFLCPAALVEHFSLSFPSKSPTQHTVTNHYILSISLPSFFCLTNKHRTQTHTHTLLLSLCAIPPSAPPVYALLSTRCGI